MAFLEFSSSIDIKLQFKKKKIDFQTCLFINKSVGKCRKITDVFTSYPTGKLHMAGAVMVGNKGY